MTTYTQTRRNGRTASASLRMLTFCAWCGVDFYAARWWAKYCCEACKIAAREHKLRVEREEMRYIHESRMRDVKIMRSIGGIYKLINDPDKSWSRNSSFSRMEIVEMIRRGHLCNGTQFYNEKSGKIYEVTRVPFRGEEQRLSRVEE